MKTINLELSKRLAPYLKERQTKYYKQFGIGNGEYITEGIEDFGLNVKTLILEEAIDFLPKEKEDNGFIYFLNFGPMNNFWYCQYEHGLSHLTFGKNQKGKTLLEAIEKMIEYLLDNDLLGKS